MKRCPQCGREYDTSMMFCLDDGAELLYGPAVSEPGAVATGFQSDHDGPQTAILPDTASQPEAATRAQIFAIDQTAGAEAEPQGPFSGSTEKRSFSAQRISKPLAFAAAVFVLVVGFFGYKYFASSDQIGSIAVMPFVNESGNTDVDYLSDGMTEMLIKSLSQVPNLAVKSRSTVFYYKGKETVPKKIGEELGVEAVLLGRVGGRGDDLKLSLELVDTRTQDVIWTEQYDRKQSDLVALQSEIAKDVSSKLKSKLSGADEAKVTKSSTANSEAYQAYLKGRYYWNLRTAENIKRAADEFKAAIDSDPNYALAYAGLADCYALQTEYAGTPPREVMPQARAFIDRAIALDPALAEPYATLGLIHHHMWEWAESEKAFKRAIELNPNYATSYHWYSILLKTLGRYQEAGKVIRRASEIDPMSGPIGNNVAMIYQVENNDAASVQASLRVVELYPNYGRGYEYLGLSYSRMGRHDEAIAAMQKAVDLTQRQNILLSELGYVYAKAGRQAEARAVIKELEERYARNQTAGHEVAGVYSGLNEKDKAFEWLEKDFQNRDSRLPTFRWEMQFQPLRDDPRFNDLLKRMNLPE